MDMTVHLINIDAQRNQLTPPERAPGQIAHDLQTLFDLTLSRARALRIAAPIQQVRVTWSDPAAQNFVARPVDIVVYFVPTTSHSVVTAIGNTVQPDANETGYTNFVNAPMGSTGAEVYCSPALTNTASRSPSRPLWTAPQLVSVAYHECMHYKLHDQQANPLHGVPGGRLARPSPAGGVHPSDGDIRAFVPALGNLWAPFTSGAQTYQQILAAEAAARRDLGRL